ncbi:hypothetical protein [Kitasatospora aureofaciens]|uniref:hypothetical protein n=1 Tax=Kitasatospora aureofaciens TaxID=1894 RepID=UPI0033C4F6A6
MTSTGSTSPRHSPASAADRYRCADCGTVKPVPSLARDCERGHYPPLTPVRGTDEVEDPDALGGFECRWYAHRGGARIRFATEAEVQIYMARLGLGKPDEFLVPCAA